MTIIPDPYMPTEEPIWKLMPSSLNRLKDFPMLEQEIYLNDIGLPLGQPVEGWTNPETVPLAPIHGNRARMEQLNQSHACDLWRLFSTDDSGNLWLNKPYGPFDNFASLEKWIDLIGTEPAIFAIHDQVTGMCQGTIGLLSNNPEFGSIQLGHLNVVDLDSPTLADAVGLLMKLVFDCG